MIVKCYKCGGSIPFRAAGVALYDSRTGSNKPIYFCSVKCRNLYLVNGFAVSTRPTPEKASTARELSQSEIRRRSRPKESDISNAIENQLIGAGAWNTRTQSGAIKIGEGHYMHLCRAGTPDRIFAAGLHVWIEVKRPGEKPKPVQVETIAKLKDNGALVFVLDNPADLTFIMQGLKRRTAEIESVNYILRTIQAEIDGLIAAEKRNPQ